MIKVKKGKKCGPIRTNKHWACRGVLYVTALNHNNFI
jgi:hypothetical protein